MKRKIVGYKLTKGVYKPTEMAKEKVRQGERERTKERS